MRAREFKAARERLGLSQAKLARALGMSALVLNAPSSINPLLPLRKQLGLSFL